MTETTIGSHRTRFISLGKKGKAEVDGKSSSLKISGVSDIYNDLFPLMEPWSSYADLKAGIGAATDTTIDGVDCKEIDIQQPTSLSLFGHPTYDIHIFLDKRTGLLRAVEYPLNQTMVYSPRNRMRVTYDDFRVEDGLRIPTTIKRAINGKIMTVLHISAIDTHQTFDDSALDF
ncbi:MAG TPA: hypothetical protein VGN16_04110 [Acidobacteriaceae bacterium]